LHKIFVNYQCLKLAYDESLLCSHFDAWLTHKNEGTLSRPNPHEFFVFHGGKIDSSFGQQYLTFSCQFKATMNDGKLFHPVRCLINLFQRLSNRVLGHASITVTICVIEVQHRILNLT
jgi:hypothetical protein